MTWLKTGSGGEYLTCPEGFAFLTPWFNASYTHGVVYHRDGRVQEIPHQDHHRPFEGVKYAGSLERAKAVAESLLRAPESDERPTVWARILDEEV